MITFRQPFKGDYPITQDYGVVIPGVTYKDRPHSGIDYGCPDGTPILASADGIVRLATFEGNGYGKYIIIEHENQNATLYAHLQGRNVRENQKVKQGDVIGISGNSGNSTGPHLHFEARKVWYDWKTHFSPRDLPLMTVDDSILQSGAEEETPISRKLVRPGFAVVVCDLANVRCHCDPSRIIKQLKKGDVVKLLDEVITYNGLPYYHYSDKETGCKLLIAEHDSFGTQILENVETEQLSFRGGVLKLRS